MKAGWEISSLGLVCSFENGDRGENYPSKSVQTTTGIPFINAGHLTDVGLDYKTMNYIPRERFNLLSNGKIQPNDILFCLRGSLGKFASVGNLSEGAIASSLVIIRPSLKVLDKFLIAYFRSQTCFQMIDNFKNGAAQPNLSAASLKNFQIPIPPIQEQQRIVAILDQAFEGIAKARTNAEQNLQNARDLFESHLQSLLNNKNHDWSESFLGDVCDGLFAGGDVPKGNSSKFKTEKYTIPIYSNGEKNKGLYGFTNTARVKKPSITISARGTIGYSQIRNEPFYPAIRLIVVTPKSDLLDLGFLKYLIENMDFIHSGVSIPQLTVPMIKEYSIKYPILDIQKVIVKNLDELASETQRLEALYQRKIALLDELKKSLLQQAFAGEL